ncbi:dihydrodipicolinate synthase family protein [Herbiconiux sp. CPCC 205763]|uniref:Dihydrodipicolinate synthase family protein n=1 Tax=Herbiconiux aconitum TaxID=2970913 RepID=A0ABT2GR61_9MICO|nr:dihydrodipicolinate synthase family protein [Herbiconiux aconitum]MCS5718708.1 dihydrodipicolinate synthase family protein [Herbiconiux aconitum]
MTTATGRRLSIPTTEGWREIELNAPRDWTAHPEPYSSRVAFAAAHVVADPHGNNVPGAPAAIDWDATLGFRRRLFEYGLGVAEAMDTAQRNMGLDWPAIQQLVSRSAAQAAEFGARIASGAGTDHLPDAATAATPASLAAVEAAYLEQVAFVEGTGSQVIVMASRHLARAAAGPDDYLAVYDRILSQVSQPVVLHWLGEAFDPQLRGYWGSTDVGTATETFLGLVRAHAAKVDGVKVSLLDASHEISLRRALPKGVRLYTGDDFNYPELIRGDDEGHSDALLGAFAAIAPAASAALAALDDGDLARYDAEMAPTLALSRHIFEAPTFYYKVGIAFTAWLTGAQSGFQMVGGLQSARSLPHLARVFELLNDARLLPDPELAVHRLGLVADSLGARR